MNNIKQKIENNIVEIRNAYESCEIEQPKISFEDFTFLTYKVIKSVKNQCDWKSCNKKVGKNYPPEYWYYGEAPVMQTIKILGELSPSVQKKLGVDNIVF